MYGKIERTFTSSSDINAQVFSEMTLENPQLREVNPQEIKRLISDSFVLIEKLEKVGRDNLLDFSISPEVADSLAAIWIHGGPGTYDKPFKNDKYQQYPWARFMDRARLNYGARILRKIAEVETGKDFKGPLANLVDRKKAVREAILETGPMVIYNGNAEEDEGVKNVLKREGVIVPESLVYIPKYHPTNTVDAVKSLSVDKEFFDNKEVGIVAHAPQVARILHILGKYNPFPESTIIRVFPIPTPQNGVDEYAFKEVRGIIFYSMVTKDASVKPHPFVFNA